MDTCILVELAGFRLSAEVFVIAQAGIDGSLQALELLMHTLFPQWAHATIDDVTGNKYRVRLLVVDDVHPAVQLVALVVVS